MRLFIGVTMLIFVFSQRHPGGLFDMLCFGIGFYLFFTGLLTLLIGV